MVQKAENARERFGTAAMQLFRARGYAETTVPQIAALAGLTERTFYRYFRDKPEVLFWRADAFEAEVAEAIAGGEASSPLLLVADALERAGRFFDEHPDAVRARQAIVGAHADFQERELLKMSALAATIGAALQARGTAPPAARMTAEAGVVIWRVAIDAWCADASRKFPHHLRTCLAQLTEAVAV